MSNNEIYHQKKIIRKQMLANRLMLTDSEYTDLSRLAQIIFLESSLYKNAMNIMMYSPIKKETDTILIAREAQKDGKNIYLPRINGWKETMEVALVNYYPEELVLGTYNIMEPHPRTTPIHPSELDVIIVPGLAFDEQKDRLGYGKKFYDNFFLDIDKKTITIGLAFERQIIDKVPADESDISLDIIITEKRMIK